MLTEELSRRLEEAADSQPYIPEVAPALHRAKRLRLRHRVMTASLGVFVVAVAVALPTRLLGRSGTTNHTEAVGFGASYCPASTAGSGARSDAPTDFGWPLRGNGPAPLPAGTTQFTSMPTVWRDALWTGQRLSDGAVPELFVEKTTSGEFITAAVVASPREHSTDTLGVHQILQGTAQISAVLPLGANGTVLVVTRPGLGEVFYSSDGNSWTPAGKIAGAQSGPGWVLFPRQVSAHLDQSPDSIRVLAPDCTVAYQGPIGQSPTSG